MKTTDALSLNSYKDLLSKCRYEIGEIKRCQSHPQYDYLVLNATIGMHHLFEWFIKQNSENVSISRKCVETFNPYDIKDKVVPRIYRRLYSGVCEIPDVNPFQKAIKDLCNKAKHFNVREIEQNKNYTCLAGSPMMQCGESQAQTGQFDHYVYSVEIEGENVDLVDLLDRELHEWTRFIDKLV